MSLVPATEPSKTTLSAADARLLTDEVKQRAEELWTMLLDLYEGGAHEALGYSSWGDYFYEEFGGTRSRAYQLLDAGRVLDSVHHGGLEVPTNERQARELVPLLKRPAQLREAWAEVVETHDEPTAADVREVVQSRMGVHYSSSTDAWSTPQDLFDQLDAEFGFTLDVCATPDNAKCPVYFTEEQDGLAQEWRGVCWMNPPYGDAISQWVRKAYESSLTGATVVCLVPGRIDTGWCWDYCRHGEVRILRGRLKFGGGENSAPFPSMVVVFRPGVTGRVLWWER